MNDDRRDDGEHDDSELLEAEVPMDAAGKRFDQVLAAMFPDFSRSRLSEWIKSGDALLDGRTVKPREAVRGGEPVAVRVMLETETRAEPEDIPLRVLHEDGELLVIDKPAGLVVHPGAGNPRGTLVNALLFRDPKLAELPRAGIVHRLDKDTSGVMVVARTLRAHTSLVEQLAGREVHRQYVAIVAGPIIAGTTIDAPIGRHPTDRVRMAVVNNGRPSVTHYRVREKFRAHTLVECRLETGRTHQIRVHMAHVKHPVIGDPMYARLTQPKGATEALSEGLRAFRRQALHAERLVFRHPASGEELGTECPIPADMQQMLALLREDSAAFKARGGR